MQIKKSLSSTFTRNSAKEMAHYIEENPLQFRELIQVFIDSPYRISQRAIVPLELCLKKNPALLLPYLPELIKLLSKEETDDSLKRNVLRTFQFVSIPRQHQGRLLKSCFAFLTHPKTPIAIKVFSMTVAANISSNLPDVKKELALIIEERMTFESAGFISRGKKILKQLAK
jgi:hypothetical protein